VHEGEPIVEGTLALASAAGGGRGGMPPEPKLDSLSRIRIGQGLRAMYSDLIREPLPAHLLTLLNQAADPEQTH
jgi:Anti-sigma factor NepR